MRRVITIQDISCLGRCSLTVALPVISAMGVETCVLPTAVLSTHTAFEGFTFCDLTDQIAPVSRHWKQEKIGFDAIYTGYLGSFEQLELVGQFIDDFKTPQNTVFIDPVMGDFGRLYTGFTPDFAKAMASLCARADVIVPNMTEAAAMLGMPYVDGGYSEGYVRDMLKRLCDLGPENAVLTGVSFEDGRIGVMGYSRAEDRFFEYYNAKINAVFHGTGDVFASTCVGAMQNGFSLEDSLRIAADFTALCIEKTMNDPARRWYGVNFEQAIPELVRLIGR